MKKNVPISYWIPQMSNSGHYQLCNHLASMLSAKKSGKEEGSEIALLSG